MVQINFALKEVNCKIVFYGPGMSGKTTNLEIVHQKAPEENKGELTSISTDGDRTLFFDFMPLDLGNVAGMRTKFQLYTVPGQVYYNSTRKLVLQGVDGVIFVADSDPEKMPENIESYQNLIDNLTEYGKDIRELPHVIQYNKRDLPNAMSVEEMDRQMNKFGVPTFEAVAYTGEGVFPTLKTLAGMVLESIDRMDSRSSKRPAAEAPRTAAPAARGAQPTRTAAPAAQKKPAAAPQRAAAAPATQRAAAAPATRTAPAKAAAAAPATAATAKLKTPAARTPATPARPTTAAQAAPATRRPGMPAPRAAQPAPKKGGGMAMVVGLSVLLIAAAAGVVWFFSSNNLL
jgi:signal recognition particle receptor subunit beta